MFFGGLAASEALVGLNYWLALKSTAARPSWAWLPPILEPSVFVGGLLLLMPLICAHITWLVTRSQRPALLAAFLYGICERYSSLVRHGIGEQVLPFVLIAIAAWLLAMAGGRRASPLWAMAAAFSAAGAMFIVPELGAGLMAGAVAVLVVTRRARRPQILAAAMFASIVAVAGGIHIWNATSLMPISAAQTLGVIDPGKFADLANTVGAIGVSLFDICWRLGGLLAIAFAIYLVPSFRIAHARRQGLRWAAIMMPMAILVVEVLFGGGRWYKAVVAVVPFVVIPAMIWRTL
jgi:hypothetical protein